MHALLLTVLAIAGGDGAMPMNAVPMNDHNVAPAGFHGGCDACGGAGGHHQQPRWMMPQTCYNPKYGCYGADRHMNRYPAFHGTYYRRPYNYRNVFDYPWHAELHEPTSFFSYHVQATDQNRPGAPPAPTPAMAQHPHSPIPMPANAQQGNSQVSPTLRTLRR